MDSAGDDDRRRTDGATSSREDASAAAADRVPVSEGVAPSDDADVGLAPTLGFLLSSVALVATLVPAREVDTGTLPWEAGADPLHWAAVALAALAAVATVAFLLRRRALIARTIGAPVATAASIAIALVAAVTLAVGVEGEATFGALVVVVLVGAGAIGAGIADLRRVSDHGLARRLEAAGQFTVLGFLGLAAIYVAGFALVIAFLLVGGELTLTNSIVLSNLGLGLGTAVVALGYLRYSDRTLSFVDLRVPTLRTLGWTVAGFLVLLAALFSVSVVIEALGAESSSHSIQETAERNPEILLVLIPASFLVIGPGEELLFRNVVQKSLYETFSRPGAVVVASAIFAVVHLPAYSTASASAVFTSLAIIFSLSLVLGAVYERTENVLVPVVIHGSYNALLFASMYVRYAG